MTNAVGVYSDLRVASGDLNEESFKDMFSKSSASGYCDFQSFVTGDYRYQHSLLKVVINSNGSSIPRITACKLTVDLPDVIDKGSLTSDELSTTSNTRVYFNRNYYFAPTVNATVISGTVIGSPVVVNVTNEYFDICVLDKSNNKIACSLNWQSRGC